jgi:hypothetical protein
MSDDRELLNRAIASTVEQLEELEQGIVLATIHIENMVSAGGVGADLKTLSGIRKRRNELEEEYVKMKVKLEKLRAGKMIDKEEARERIQKARHNMNEAKKLFEEQQDKDKERKDQLYDPTDDDELKDVTDTGAKWIE